jgi:hypothetical protein
MVGAGFSGHYAYTQHGVGAGSPADSIAEQIANLHLLITRLFTADRPSL